MDTKIAIDNGRRWAAYFRGNTGYLFQDGPDGPHCQDIDFIKRNKLIDGVGAIYWTLLLPLNGEGIKAVFI